MNKFISILAPARVATVFDIPEIALLIPFQSSLPRGERPEPHIHHIFYGSNFNPRSREGSDIACCGEFIPFAISILAPARGATLQVSVIPITL